MRSKILPVIRCVYTAGVRYYIVKSHVKIKYLEKLVFPCTAGAVYITFIINSN